MAFFPFNRTQKKMPAKPIVRAKTSDDKSQLTLQLEEVKRQRQELLRRTEEAQRKVEDIPKKIAERKRREVERIHERAQNHKTLRGFRNLLVFYKTASEAQRHCSEAQGGTIHSQYRCDHQKGIWDGCSG